MALASLCGGLALANAKLGAVHGFAGVLGGMFDAPHGVICGRLLPFVMQANVQALEMRENQHPTLQRYAEIANLLFGTYSATAGDSVLWVHELAADLQVPGLGSFGITAAHFPAIIEKAQRSSSMRGNPIQLTVEELKDILYLAL
jgi:alcohol dehydrogenase class IV